MVSTDHRVLGYLLKHAFLQLSARVDAALEPFGIDRTTMVALLDVLEGKGIVARRPDPADRRRNVVELTEEGQRIYDAAEAEHRAAEDAFLAAVDGDSAQRLRATLRTLIEAG